MSSLYSDMLEKKRTYDSIGLANCHGLEDDKRESLNEAFQKAKYDYEEAYRHYYFDSMRTNPSES